MYTLDDDNSIVVGKDEYYYLRQHCQICPSFNATLGLEKRQSLGYSLKDPSSLQKRRKTSHFFRGRSSVAGALVTQDEQQSRGELNSVVRALPLPYHRPLPQPLEPFFGASLPPAPSVSSCPDSTISESTLDKALLGSGQPPFRLPCKKAPKTSITLSKRSNAENWFFNHIPDTDTWHDKQAALGLCDPKSYRQTIEAIVGVSNLPVVAKQLPQCDPSEGKLVGCGLDLAERTHASIIDAVRTDAFARFSTAVFLSYCYVLPKLGVSQRNVDRILEKGLNDKAERFSLLRSVPWINGTIVGLNKHGWTVSRATELFLLNSLSFSKLRYIKVDKDAPDRLKHYRRDESDFRKCLTPQYTIPGLIIRLVQADDAQAATIYNVLGYSEVISQCTKDIFTVLPPSESEFHVISSEAFTCPQSGESFRSPASSSVVVSTSDHPMALQPAGSDTDVDCEALNRHQMEGPFRVDKTVLANILLNASMDTISTVWFGCPDGLPPVISMGVPNSIGAQLAAVGEKVDLRTNEESTGQTSTVTVDVAAFRRLFEGDGFGWCYWNGTEKEGMVSIEVVDQDLIGEFHKIRTT